MSDELTEAVAQTIYERIHKRHKDSSPWSLLTSTKRNVWLADARACLAAIEASGTHKIVPANYEITFVGDMDVTDWLLYMAEQQENEDYSFSLESAAKEITRLRSLLGATSMTS